MIDRNGDVVHEVEVGLAVEDVFAFFTDAERLVRWIGLSASLAPVAGGEFRFEVQPGHYCEGAYVEVRPPTFVSFTWGWTDPAWNLPPGSSLVEVVLSPVDGGTRVRLTHTRLPGDLRAIHDEGWATFLARLLDATAGREPAAYPPEGETVKPVTVEVEIERPCAVVWEYMENAEHNPEWLANMQSARWLTERPIRVGSRYDQVARFLGKEVRTSFEVTAHEEGRLITIASLPGSSFPITITRSVQPAGADRCRVTETAGGDSSGFYRVAEPLLRPMVRRNISVAYRRLKRMLESAPATSAAS